MAPPHCLQSIDKQSMETDFFCFNSVNKFPSANRVSPCCLICDRLLETDRAWLDLWVLFSCTLICALSKGWSHCEMANGARDIILQTPGLQCEQPPVPLLFLPEREPKKKKSNWHFSLLPLCLLISHKKTCDSSGFNRLAYEYLKFLFHVLAVSAKQSVYQHCGASLNRRT